MDSYQLQEELLTVAYILLLWYKAARDNYIGPSYVLFSKIHNGSYGRPVWTPHSLRNSLAP